MHGDRYHNGTIGVFHPSVYTYSQNMKSVHKVVLASGIVLVVLVGLTGSWWVWRKPTLSSHDPLPLYGKFLDSNTSTSLLDNICNAGDAQSTRWVPLSDLVIPEQHSVQISGGDRYPGVILFRAPRRMTCFDESCR